MSSNISPSSFFYENVCTSWWWWCFCVFQDHQIPYLDCQWNSSPQTPVSCRRSTQGQCLQFPIEYYMYLKPVKKSFSFIFFLLPTSSLLWFSGNYSICPPRGFFLFYAQQQSKLLQQGTQQLKESHYNFKAVFSMVIVRAVMWYLTFLEIFNP